MIINWWHTEWAGVPMRRFLQLMPARIHVPKVYRLTDVDDTFHLLSGTKVERHSKFPLYRWLKITINPILFHIWFLNCYSWSNSENPLHCSNLKKHRWSRMGFMVIFSHLEAISNVTLLLSLIVPIEWEVVIPITMPFTTLHLSDARHIAIWWHWHLQIPIFSLLDILIILLSWLL